jgi:hypothetical protein
MFPDAWLIAVEPWELHLQLMSRRWIRTMVSSTATCSSISTAASASHHPVAYAAMPTAARKSHATRCRMGGTLCQR